MTRHLRGLTLRALLLVGICAMPAAAQSTMTITGHVSAAQLPVRGARIRIDSLDLGATTDENGRYSFIVPSARVRGQTVQMTVMYPRFRTQTADVALLGVSLVKDFELAAETPVGEQRPANTAPGGAPPPTTVRAPVSKPAEPTATLPVPVTNTQVVGVRATVPVQAVDSTVFTDLAGMVDIASALQGRMAGVDVMTTSTLGGTNSIVVRGPRSLLGNTQPLVVVNGIIIDNSNITTPAQRSGLGGFDYGTLLADLNVEDVASLHLLTGPEATLRYGGRAATGVLVVTTRSARGLNGFEVAASQQISGSSLTLLPNFQDAFGQGLNGQFSFFNGKGGGVNDATDESWGPALNGSPVPQASLSEAGRPTVRTWNAVPNNVSSYFGSGHAFTTNVALLGGNEKGYARGSVSSRTSTGVVPSASVTTRAAVLTAVAQPSTRIALTGDLQYYNTVGADRPATGFDESNVVSQFSHMPRQIDVAAYQTQLRDNTGAQLSWNYSGRNNPWVATLENRNHDDRSRIIAGASGSVSLSSLLTASLRFGADHSTDTRNFSVASGWMGGYPYYAGRGDFANGGFETDDITRNGSSGEFVLRAAPTSAGGLSVAFSGGVGRRADGYQFAIHASDKATEASSSPTTAWGTNSSTNYLFAGAETFVRDLASLTIGARQEISSLVGASSVSTLYPAVVASVDLMRLDSARKTGVLESFVLHGGWSRSGNEATSAVLHRFGFTAIASGTSFLESVAAPELTTGFEIGVSLTAMNRRLTAGLSTYNDRSENLVLPTGASFAQTGVVSNKGVEAAAAVVLMRSNEGAEWTIGANVAKNTNLVEALGGGVTSVQLATPFNGMSVEARVGQPLGVLTGLGFLRDAGGNLVLRKGLPVADSAAGVRVLGESAPAWIGGLTTALRMRGVELSAMLDAHHGGKVFSSTNRAGAVSGAFAETAVRPDSGLVIAGVDATGSANTTHVSTEAYYHALAPITERWLYDASFVKLREVRVSYVLPLQFISALRAQTVRASFVGRNLLTWASAPNIDPETVLSTSTARGIEMGQLPSVRTVGVQITLVP